MEDFTSVHNTLNEENVFANIVFFIQNIELGKLWTPRCYIHVCLWPLKTVTVQSWLERLNDVLPVVLICMNKISSSVK